MTIMYTYLQNSGFWREPGLDRAEAYRPPQNRSANLIRLVARSQRAESASNTRGAIDDDATGSRLLVFSFRWLTGSRWPRLSPLTMLLARRSGYAGCSFLSLVR
jgi:hypothetical protein